MKINVVWYQEQVAGLYSKEFCRYCLYDMLCSNNLFVFLSAPTAILGTLVSNTTINIKYFIGKRFYTTHIIDNICSTSITAVFFWLLLDKRVRHRGLLRFKLSLLCTVHLHTCTRKKHK